MQETYSAKAIILDKRPFKEYDAVVSVFCADKGRLELVARGVKRPNSKLAGHTEPITLAKIMTARGRQYDYLAAAANENSFFNIKNDFDKINAAGRAIGIFKKLVKENEKDEKLFYLLYEFLAALNNCQFSNYQLFFHSFVLKLLAHLGYRPELRDCAVCKKRIVPNNNKFDVSKGGVVCGACDRRGAALTITDNCVKILRIILKSDFNGLLKIKTDRKLEREVEKIIGSFYEYRC